MAKQMQVLTPIMGLISPEQYINIRFADLQRARYAMKIMQSEHKRSDCPAEWSAARKALNLAQRTWDSIKGI